MKLFPVVLSSLVLFASSANFALASESSTSKDLICKKARASIHQHFREKCMSESEWQTWTSKAQKQLKRQASYTAAVNSQPKAILEEGDAYIISKAAVHHHPKPSLSDSTHIRNDRARAKIQ